MYKNERIYLPLKTPRGVNVTKGVKPKKKSRGTVASGKRDKDSQKVKSKLDKLLKYAESDMGTHIQRIRDVYRQLSSVNQKAHGGAIASSTAVLETVLSELRYYDPSAPSALVQASGATGSYQKEFYFEKVYSKITIRNNYQLPVDVSLYACVPKVDTSITPNTAFTNGLADIGNPTSTCPLLYPTDSEQFNDLWKIDKSKKKSLKPGEQISLAWSGKSFQYDPSFVDSHALSYQKKYSSLVWHFTNSGVLAHDSSFDEQGLAQSGIDVIVDTTFIVKYAAGADIKYLVCTDNSDTFSNGALASSMPVADNIGYSVN